MVGRHLVEEALRRGYEVLAPVRSPEKAKDLTDPGIHLVHTDLTDPAAVRDLFRLHRPDYVIHNAGVTKLNVRQSADYAANVEMVRILLDAASEWTPDLKKFVFNSSLEAGGPGDETTMQPKRIGDDAQPVTDYGRSKREAEQVITDRASVPYVIFRPGGVYGRYDRGLLPYFSLARFGILPLFVSDRQRISVIYAKDLARLFLDSLASDVSSGTYYASDGQVYTTAEFAGAIARQLNKAARTPVIPRRSLMLLSRFSESLAKYAGFKNFLPEERVRQLVYLNWSCDISETVRAFGFKPDYMLEEGLADASDWYLKGLRQ